jgi:hypothetical protein
MADVCFVDPSAIDENLRQVKLFPGYWREP